MNLFFLKKEEFGLFLGEEGKGRCLAKCGNEKILKKQNLVFGVYQAQSVKVWKWAAPMSALVAKALVFFFKQRRNEEDWELVFFVFVVRKLPGQTTVDREKHGKLKTRERRGERAMWYHRRTYLKRHCRRVILLLETQNSNQLMKATKSSRLSLFSVFAFCLAKKDQPLSFPLCTTTVIFGFWSIFQYSKVKSTTLISFITLLFLSLSLSNQLEDENGKKKG